MVALSNFDKGECAVKIKNRYLLFNKYVVIASLLLISVSFLSWAIFSEYFSAVFFWDLSEMGVTRAEYFGLIFPFHNYVVDGFSLLQLILPIFSMLIVIPFLNSKKMLLFTYTRDNSYNRALITNIAKTVLVGATVLFSAYLVFMMIGLILLPISADADFSRELFSDILGPDFYSDFTVLYYVLEGFLKYFVFTVVYALFAIAVSFLTSNNYYAIIVPFAYYAVLAILIAVVGSAFGIDLMFLSPTYTVLANSRPYMSIVFVLAPLLPPLAFSVYVIRKNLITKKNRDDVYGVT